MVDLSIVKFNASLVYYKGELHASQQGNFKWLDCSSGFIIAGASGNVLKPPVNGAYAVIITYMGCTDTSECLQVYSVGMLEKYETTMKVYPNPTSTDINLDFISVMENVQVTQRDITGRVVTSISYNSVDRIEYYLKGEAGISFIEILTKDKRALFKVIKE